MTRYDGHAVSQATVLRILRRRGLILAADYQRERRQLAAERRAVFVTRRPDRTRSGSWTSPSSRQSAAGPGGSRHAPTTGPRSSSAGTSR